MIDALGALPQAAHQAMAGVFGLVIGSFLNVVIHRVPAGSSLNTPSRCPQCDHRISWWENVPIVSWLLLRGRCHDCHLPIPARYPLVELGTALAFVAVATIVATTVDAEPLVTLLVTLALLWLAAVSIVLVAIHLDRKPLPHSIIDVSLVVVALLWVAASATAGQWGDTIRALLGLAALAGLALLMGAVAPRRLDASHVRLAGLMGLSLGWFGWVHLAVGAFAVGTLAAVALTAFARTEHPRAPDHKLNPASSTNRHKRGKKGLAWPTSQ